MIDFQSGKIDNYQLEGDIFSFELSEVQFRAKMRVKKPVIDIDNTLVPGLQYLRPCETEVITFLS